MDSPRTLGLRSLSPLQGGAPRPIPQQRPGQSLISSFFNKLDQPAIAEKKAADIEAYVEQAAARLAAKEILAEE